MPRLDARGCLGLLLVITGIRSLGSPLLGLFQMLRFDSDPDSTTIVLTALPLATSVLQIGAGCAFAFHKPTAGWIALTGYLMSVVGFVVVFVFELRPREVGGLSLLAMAGESLGHPIVFVVALAMARTAGSNARREVGVMLIIYALSGLLGIAVQLVEQVRIIIEVAPDGAHILSQLAWIAAYLAVALLQLRAGLRLYRGSEGRSLGVYVVAAIANEVLWMAVYAIIAVVDGQDDPRLLTAMHAIGAFIAIAFPLFLWGFVRSQPAGAGGDPHLPMLPTWNALLYLPFLALRPLALEELVVSRWQALSGTLTMALGAAVVALGVSTVLATVMALRERRSTKLFAIVATVIALVLISGIVVAMYTETAEPIRTGPFLQIAAIMAVLAWVHRAPIARSV